MADGDFRSASVQGRGIRLTDLLFGADPSESNLADGGRSDTLAQLIVTIRAELPDRWFVSAADATARAALSSTDAPTGTVVFQRSDDTLWERLATSGGSQWAQISLGGGVELATSGTPAAPSSTASRGTGSTAARDDHVHPAQTVPAPATMAPGNTPGVSAVGTSARYARGDHDHGISPGSSDGSGVALSDDDPVALGSTAAEGTASEASRQDHRHPTTGLAVLQTQGAPHAPASTASRGTGATASRSDHVHPEQDVPEPSDTAPGNTPGSPSAGTSTEISRADHDHGITPGSGGTSGAGSSETGYSASGVLTFTPVTAAVAVANNSEWEVQVLSDTFAAGITAGVDFWSVYSGFLYLDVDTSTNYEIWLEVEHSYTIKGVTTKFVSRRTVLERIGAGGLFTLPLNAFSSVSVVRLGTFTDSDGDQVTITEAMVNSETALTIRLGVKRENGQGFALEAASIGSGTVNFFQFADPDDEGTAVSAHTPAAGDDELSGVDIGGTDYEIVDREGRDRLRAVEQRVHPIREVPQTWADISDGSAGWSAPAGLLTTVTPISALTFANTARTGTSAQFVYVRIPIGAIQSNYRFQYTVTGGSQAGETHNRVLGTWSGERVGADSSWQYYRISFYEGEGFSGGKLQFGGSDLFEWEGALTKNAVDDQLEAIGIPQAIDALKNVTRDLHLDGTTRLVKNTAAATAGVARVAVANASRQAIEAGTTNLDVQGVTFTATLANAHFGTTATTTDQAIIRLAQTEDRGDWRILFDDTAFLAGGWVPINVSNGTAGYDYYISGKVDRTTEIALYKSTEETTFHGELAEGIVDLDDLSATGTPSAATYLRGDNSWADSPTDEEIGDKAFSNPPSDLSDSEKAEVRADIGAGEPVYGSNTIRKEDTGHLRLRAPDLHLGLWGRSADDNTVPLGADDPANAVPVRLTEVRSTDERTTAALSDVLYDAAGPQGDPEVLGTIKVLHSADTTITGFGSGAGYDSTKPGFVWDETNSRFHHNGVAASVANSGSATNKFRLRVEVDYKHHIAVGSEEANLRLELDVPVKFGVDRQHDWRNINLQDFPTTEVRTLSYQVDIQSAEAPAVTDYLTVKLRSIQSTSQVLFVEAVRIHFVLPDSNNVNYLQEFDLNNAVSWVGRNVLGPALGSHTDNRTNAEVKIEGGRMVATDDIAVLQLISNARTGVAGNGHNIRLMTRVPGLQAPTVLHEWDDSTNVWRVVHSQKGVVEGQEFWVEADTGATYSSVGSPNFVWDSTRHDSDVTDTLIYPGLVKVMTQAEYDALSWANPYQLYFIEDSS